jgi:hypothetical protein
MSASEVVGRAVSGAVTPGGAEALRAEAGTVTTGGVDGTGDGTVLVGGVEGMGDGTVLLGGVGLAVLLRPGAVARAAMAGAAAAPAAMRSIPATAVTHHTVPRFRLWEGNSTAAAREPLLHAMVGSLRPVRC